MRSTLLSLLLFAMAGSAYALPNSGSTNPPPPPPPADPYVLVLVFTVGEPAAAIDKDPETQLPKRYDTLNACTTAGNNWMSAAANPAGQTVLKFNCVQVKPKEATNYLLGNGQRLTAAPGNYLLAR